MDPPATPGGEKGSHSHTATVGRSPQSITRLACDPGVETSWKLGASQCQVNSAGSLNLTLQAIGGLDSRELEITSVRAQLRLGKCVKSVCRSCCKSPSATPSAAPSATPSATLGVTPGAMPGATLGATPIAMPSAKPRAPPRTPPRVMPGAMPDAILPVALEATPKLATRLGPMPPSSHSPEGEKRSQRAAGQRRGGSPRTRGRGDVPGRSIGTGRGESSVATADARPKTPLSLTAPQSNL